MKASEHDYLIQASPTQEKTIKNLNEYNIVFTHLWPSPHLLMSMERDRDIDGERNKTLGSCAGISGIHRDHNEIKHKYAALQLFSHFKLQRKGWGLLFFLGDI